MVKLKEYNHGVFKKVLKLSDKDFTVMLLNGSIEFTHSNKAGNWYRDCGLGVYLLIY